jgi:hypothetical protein
MLVDVRCCWVMWSVLDLYRDAGPWLDEGAMLGAPRGVPPSVGSGPRLR